MSWKETCPMSERILFVSEALRRQRTMEQLCLAYGISRKTGYKWLERYRQGGEPALADRSHARLHQEQAVAPEVVGQLLGLKRKHPHWGPATLRECLRRSAPERTWPAVSTVGEILKRHGLVKPRARRRRLPPNQGSTLVQPYAANVLWCTDFKGEFRNGDQRYCYPLTLTDAYSRYLLACRGLRAPTTELVRPWMERAFREYGLPLVIRSDNGPPFASTTGLAGLSRLSVWWIKLGIAPERIAPGKPQQNGRHERMHRTLKQETTQPPAAHARAQQRLFDAFVMEFNHDRPHAALQMRSPAQLYEPSSRPYPQRMAPIEYPDGYEVRRVRSNGEIKFLGQHLFLGEALIGEPVGLQRVAEQTWQVNFSFLPIALLDASTMSLRSAPPANFADHGGAAPPMPPAD